MRDSWRTHSKVKKVFQKNTVAVAGGMRSSRSATRSYGTKRSGRGRSRVLNPSSKRAAGKKKAALRHASASAIASAPETVASLSTRSGMRSGSRLHGADAPLDTITVRVGHVRKAGRRTRSAAAGSGSRVPPKPSLACPSRMFNDGDTTVAILPSGPVMTRSSKRRQAAPGHSI